MQLAQQILFILISGVSVFFFTKKIKEISRNINLGRDEKINDTPGKRWKKLVPSSPWLPFLWRDGGRDDDISQIKYGERKSDP